MSDTHAAQGHHEMTLKTYMVVFAALCICTALSFVAYSIFSRETSYLIIMAVAVVKAVIVAIYFMHLLFDWGKLYYMIIPALILGVLLVVVLLPDIVLSWHSVSSVPKP